MTNLKYKKSISILLKYTNIFMEFIYTLLVKVVFFIKIPFKSNSSPGKDVKLYPSGVRLDNQNIFSYTRS